MSTAIFENGKKLPLMEEFYTLQGEGYHSGKAAYFIRIGGCDIGCYWCDTKLSWNPKTHKLVTAESIVQHAKDNNTNSVVVTGGEPSMYQLDYLTKLLKKEGIQTFVETSGAYHLTGKWDWICLSPKKQSPPQEAIFNNADELKMIIFENSDFEWAEINAQKVTAKTKLFLQPEWSRHKTMIPKIVEYIKKNPQWAISLQSHKFMHIP